MVQIPRYKEEKINLPTGGTDLTVAATGSRTLSSVAGNIRTLATNIHKQRTAIEVKLRQLEIKTNKELGNSLIYKNVTEYLDSLLDRDDFLTPDVWGTDYEKKQKDWKKDFKKQFDDETFTQFLPIFNNNVFEGKTKVNDKIRQQKIKNATVVYGQSVETYRDKLDKATSIGEIGSAWVTMEDIIKENVSHNLFEKEIAVLQRIQLENEKEIAIAWLAVKEDEWTQSPFGTNETDWEAVLNNLKEKSTKKGYEGKFIYAPDLDPDLRKIMITEADKNFSNQYQTHSQMREKKNRAVKRQLTDDLIEIQEGTAKGLIIADTFADRIQASDLPETEKRALANKFFTWQQGGAGELWETDMGKKASIMAHMVVYNGLIDTETERIFLTELMNNGLLKTEDYRTLNNKIDENIKDKNFYKKTLYKRAIVMIAKEVGDTKAIRLFQDMDLTKVENLADLISPQLSEEVYEAINYFDQVLAEGERQGFNYVNMLAKKGDNYLMDDVVEFARQVKGYRGAGTIEFSEQFKSMEGFDPNKPYWLAPEVWFYGKDPLLAMDIPLRNKDENVPQYLNRVSDELRKKGNLLPSTLTGFQFDEDFDLNTFAIIPDIAE